MDVDVWLACSIWMLMFHEVMLSQPKLYSGYVYLYPVGSFD